MARGCGRAKRKRREGNSDTIVSIIWVTEWIRRDLLEVIERDFGRRTGCRRTRWYWPASVESIRRRINRPW